MAREVFELAEREGVLADLENTHDWIGRRQGPVAALWDTKRELRKKLVNDVRERVRKSWLQRGAAPAELGWVDSVLDPDVLTIGFARRVPTYKRLTLMLRDPDRLKRCCSTPSGRSSSSSPARRTRPTRPARS